MGYEWKPATMETRDAVCHKCGERIIPDDLPPDTPFTFKRVIHDGRRVVHYHAECFPSWRDFAPA